MKRYYILLVLLMLGYCSTGQVNFSYDAAGNRIKRFTGSGARVSAEELPAPLEEILTKFYPNPVKDILFVDAENVKMVLLYNTAGETVYKNEKIAVEGINMSSFSSGVYIISILKKDGSRVSGKVVKLSD